MQQYRMTRQHSIFEYINVTSGLLGKASPGSAFSGEGVAKLDIPPPHHRRCLPPTHQATVFPASKLKLGYFFAGNPTLESTKTPTRHLRKRNGNHKSRKRYNQKTPWFALTMWYRMCINWEGLYTHTTSPGHSMRKFEWLWPN